MKRIVAGVVLSVMTAGAAGAATPPPRVVHLGAPSAAEHVTYTAKAERSGCPKGHRWVAASTKKNGKRISGYCR